MNVIGMRLSRIVSPDAVVLKTETRQLPSDDEVLVLEHLDVDGDGKADAIRNTYKDAAGQTTGQPWYSTQTLISRAHAQDQFQDFNGDGRVDYHAVLEGGTTSIGEIGGAMVITEWSDQNGDGIVDRRARNDFTSTVVLLDTDYDGIFDIERRRGVPTESGPTPPRSERAVSIPVSSVE